jgi:glutathione reductase (NADPH)
VSRFDFDLFTIGAGSGGVAATRRAAEYGARAAICEERRIGGTCVLRGCVPKKLLVYGSSFGEAFADARGYGWRIEEPILDWTAMQNAKRDELDRLNRVYVKLLADAGVRSVEGRGVIVDPHTVEVAGRRYTAERILIATGGWPATLEIPGARLAISSNEALELATCPRHIVIAGGGYVGVEFAGIFRSFGSEVVHVVRRPLPLAGFDDDAREALATEMRGRGVDLRAGRRLDAIVEDGGALNAVLDDGSRVPTDAVLIAVGRTPLSCGIGLEHVGVELDERGFIAVDRWSKTSVASIWAVGDVTTRPALTPVAIADGRAFALTEFGGRKIAVDHENIPTAVFSQPPLATVGLTEEQALARFGEIDVYRARFRPMKYVLARRETKTMMKLVVERAGNRVVGVHMVGDDAPEIIQGFAVAVRCGATKEQFDATVGVHPTSAEEFVTMR